MRRRDPFGQSDRRPVFASLSDEIPDVTVLIVNYNTAQLLDKLFASLEAARGGLSLQVIVVDNASHDDSVSILRTRFPDAELIANSVNVGFGRANNQALSLLRGRYLLLLNTDAFMASDALQKTVIFMDTHPHCGVLGVKLVGSDGLLQPSCRYFPNPWNVFLASTDLKRFFPRTRHVDDMSWDHASVRECDWVPGCFYLVRREVIDTIGLFDPRYFLYYEEVDHCRAVRKKGWSVTYYPWTHVVHVGGASAETEGPLTHSGRQISLLQMESELLYFRKHYGLLGVLTFAVLVTLADFLTALKHLALRLDTERASKAAHHTWITLKLLVKTKLGSRAIH